MGTGFFRVTTGRIAFDATTLLRKTRANVSVPYSCIHVIATHDEASLFPARLTRQQQAHVATSAGDYEVGFAAPTRPTSLTT